MIAGPEFPTKSQEDFTNELLQGVQGQRSKKRNSSEGNSGSIQSYSSLEMPEKLAKAYLP